jgi:hypothetical protein
VREVRTGMAANGGEAASLVESAMLLRWRAPELALLLADRAVTAAQDDKIARLRADHLAVFALNRLGRHAEAAYRLFPAIRDANTPPGLRHELHVELGHCTAALGEPAIALGAVRTVLAAGDDVAPALRGRALVAVAEASAVLGSDDLVSFALAEADELYREDSSLDHDTALLLRAAVRATDVARHRARGAGDKAEAKAREGRELLAGLADPDHDSGEVSARLMLELVLTLLDRGAGEIATQEVRPLLQRQVRAAAAGTVGRLRLALATRVHLAQGRHEPALTLLADAVEGAQRYGVDAVLAECLEGLSHVHEARNEFADALHCMRAARAAEGRHRHEVEDARSFLLENCGYARREEARLVGQIAELLTNAGAGCAGLDADTGPLPGEVTTEVTTESSASPSAAPETPKVGIADAEITEADAPVAGVAEEDLTGVEVGEAAVAAEENKPVAQDADLSRALDSWQSRARHHRGGAGTLVSVSDLVPASALSAGRSGRRRAEEPTEEGPHEASTGDQYAVDQHQRANDQHQSADDQHRTAPDGPEEGGESSQQGADVRDLASTPTPTHPEAAASSSDLAVTPEGEAISSIPAEDAERVSAVRREFPASGPPPAPTPRALELEPRDGDSAEKDKAPKMGLGHLLAEALAAYKESRDLHAEVRSAGMLRHDKSSTANAEITQDLPRYPGSGARWTASLALAPNLSEKNLSTSDLSGADLNDPDPDDSDPSAPDNSEPLGLGEITSPLLRLPDLTAEPRWGSPETGRRSAAGD